MTDHHVPPERDLPAGRLSSMKDVLMSQIEHDLETEPPVAPVVTHRRWRRVGLAAAALAAFGLVTSLVIGGGDDRASANTAVRTDDGAILITINEGKNPEDLQRRLNDLGVPAVVDFLESGYRVRPGPVDRMGGGTAGRGALHLGAHGSRRPVAARPAPRPAPARGDRGVRVPDRRARGRDRGQRDPAPLDDAGRGVRARCPTPRSSTPREASPAADPGTGSHRSPERLPRSGDRRARLTTPRGRSGRRGTEIAKPAGRTHAAADAWGFGR